MDAYKANGFSGIGFMLSTDNDIAGLDIDHCRDAESKKIEPWALEIVDELNTYTEVSPSGTGLRAFFHGGLPPRGRKKGNVELYDTGRYLTVTGQRLPDTPQTLENRQSQVEALHQKIFADKPKTPSPKTRPTAGTDLDDKVLLKKMFASKDGPDVERLFRGEWQAAYPSQSEADLALCNSLAFWFNRDPQRIDRVFRKSGLLRDKWDRDAGQGTYGERTVEKAIKATTEVYTPGKQPTATTKAELEAKIKATEDVDELLGPVLKEVATSGLSESLTHLLKKSIAKKTGVPLAAINADAQKILSKTEGKKLRHLSAAQGIVKDFGKENVLTASQFVWRWNGCGVWKRLDDREIKNQVHKTLEAESVTKSAVESVLDLFKTETFAPEHEFDRAGRSINVKNGELHWTGKIWELRPHDREHFRTVQLPVTYNPKAKAPRFNKFLNEIFAHDPDINEKIQIVHEAIGYSLLPSCEYEKFLLLIGPGANGKSVLMAVIEALVGRESVCAVQPSQFENKFQRAHLYGKLVNLVTEIAEGHEIADAQLKAITSGELTTAEHKHKPPFNFHPFCTCWFGTNHMPHTRDFSDALFRRAIIVTFNRVFAEKEQDPHLKTKLQKELPGILNLALEGLARLFKSGQFTLAESGEEAKAEWRLNCDQVAQFAEDECVTG
ncbi:MAG: phage/plasmid primase, P4 family, partial [Thermodesulfobacteriota bacterium]|nr:phage/plasmid primase, P4 family [Thermodesulfobacteriota bacterium]